MKIYKLEWCVLLGSNDWNYHFIRHFDHVWWWFEMSHWSAWSPMKEFNIQYSATEYCTSFIFAHRSVSQIPGVPCFHPLLWMSFPFYKHRLKTISPINFVHACNMLVSLGCNQCHYFIVLIKRLSWNLQHAQTSIARAIFYTGVSHIWILLLAQSR